MWKVLEEGVAQWQIDDTYWNVIAPGGDGGIAILGRDRGQNLVQLRSVGDDVISPVADSYVRGDGWHVVYPQTDNAYSLKLVLTPIESSASELLLEITVSIQTRLLDSHPTIDLIVPGDGLQVWTPPQERQWIAQSDSVNDMGASCLTGVVGPGGAVSVMLGRRDYPHTLDLSDDHAIRLRLFGDFLEKGVIRVARPWVCIQKEVKDIDEDGIADLWTRQSSQPLPLD